MGDNLHEKLRNQPLLYIPSGRQAPQFPDKHPPVYCLPEAEFVQELLKEYPETLRPVLQNKELRQLYLPLLRADFELSETYQYQESMQMDCPIVAFAGDNEPNIGEEELQAWAKHTTSQFQAYRFPGDHFFIRCSEAQVLQTIKHELAVIIETFSNTDTKTCH